MRGSRLTVGGLGLAVALIALLLAAWRADEPLPSFLVLFAVVLTLKLAFVLAIVATGRARRFWIGFAPAGLAYLVASSALPWIPTEDWIASFDRLTSPGDPGLLPGDLGDLGERQHPSQLSADIHSFPDRPTSPTEVTEGYDEVTSQVVPIGLSAAHRTIGHSALTVAVAIAAGCLVLAWPTRRRASPSTEARP